MQCTVCSMIFSQKMALVTWMPEPRYRLTGQSKKMAAEQLSFESRKIVFRCNWKFENVCEAQRQWRREFATESPTRLTIACIRDKAETDGTMHDVHKQRPRRACTATSPASSAMVYTITCFGHPFYLPFISSMGMGYFSFIKMEHHHTTTETSEDTLIKPYQING
jgi:hypothetical protein